MNRLGALLICAASSAAACGQAPGAPGTHVIGPLGVNLDFEPGICNVWAALSCDCEMMAFYVAPCPPASGTPVFLGTAQTYTFMSFSASFALPLALPDDPALSGVTVSALFMVVCVGDPECPPVAECLSFTLP